MITHEQVADLHEGDVVRVTGWYGLTVEGPVSVSKADSDTLWLGQHLRLSYVDAGMPTWTDAADATLTVVSRAPRPLYVNHRRTEPVLGDVVADPADQSGRIYWRHGQDDWFGNDAGRFDDDQMPKRLRLLVDGETGQVVPS